MTKNVTVLNRTQKVQLIHLTMQGLQSKIYYLYENYNSYHENYSEQALQLYNVYNKYESAVQNLLVTEEMNKLDDDGLSQMASLSLEVSELYKLGVRTPDDQKEYEATIKQFKEDVYAEALKRLEENRKEVDTYEKTLLSEVGNKKGENLKPVYQAFDLNAEYLDNEQKKIQAYYAHDSELFSKYYERNNAIQREIEILKSEYPLVKHLTNIKTIVPDINKLCKKIRTAQNNIEKKLTNKKFPIWELNPIIASLFETNEFYDSEKQEYIFDWIKEQERVDELKDVFKNAIPIALSIMCFFVSGGVSLLVQVLNAAVGAAAAIDDFNDANDLRNMATSQMHISDEAKHVIETSDLSAIEKNYAMAIFSGVFVVADFVDCIKVARKLGIGDEVMDFISKGKTKLSVDETDDLVIKARKATVTDSVKMSPEEILHKAGYKRQSLIDENIAIIEKLQFEVPDDELIKILTKMKKKGLEKSIEHVNKIIDVIDNIHVSNRSLVINNAESIRELKKYYTTQEITDILNNVDAENFEATIKKMTNIQKQLLSKQISSGETNKFARELLTELELKHGITEEKLNILRNLDYNKMTKEDYEKLKPEIDAIISLTRSYDLNKVKPGKMRKYIPVEDMEKYLSGKFGNRSYDGIRGFIARQDDALQLKTFDDIFYTMRLDYEGNTFIYNREIAYIDFVATSYEDTFVPIGKLYGGTEKTPSPFGGMGLLKTENGQIIREYKVKYEEKLAFNKMNEAVMYKIDKTGKVELIAVYDTDIKDWIRK